MNIKQFFVDALRAAIELKVATYDDVLRHVTPEVLSVNLPRPLWARLLTACLGAPRVDAQLVVETIGIPNVCEHVPSPLIWSCIAEFAARALGQAPSAKTTQSARALVAPPPDIANAPTATGVQDINDLEQSDEPRRGGSQPRSPAAQRFRQSNTGNVARGLNTNVRRPQAAAPSAPTILPRPSANRRGAEPEPEPATSVETSDWGGKEIAVDDSQLVDWQTDVGTASAITGDDDFSDLGNRKR